MSIVLRPNQVSLVKEIKAALLTGCSRLIAQAPTGFGKTIVACDLLREIERAGLRAIMTVPALSLVDQTVDKLFAGGVRSVGVMQANHPMTNPDRLIQIATPQTLQRRKIPSADLILIDEAHIQFKVYKTLFREFPDTPIIGLTATPWSKALGKDYERLIIGSTTRQLIEEKYLSPFRAFAPSSPDLTGVRIKMGDYREDDLSRAMNKVQLVANVVETWQAHGQNRPTLCFAVDRAHAKSLQMQFQGAGISAEYVDAYTKGPERLEISKRFHAGEVKIVCNVGCLTTGVDWDVRCIILARPTKSEMLYVQMVGRGLRIAEGKKDCLILDHSDNTVRLGFVTDIHHDELDDGEPKRTGIADKAEALPKKCIKCSFLKPPKTLQCPCCGFIPEPQPGAVHKEGELRELTDRSTVRSLSTQERITFYSELRGFAKERGFKDGWAAHKYREKHGDWPPRLWNEFPSLNPSGLTRSWVKSRFIAYSKARTNHDARQ
jgi:superfamily II DNA or RNA helicase